MAMSYFWYPKSEHQNVFSINTVLGCRKQLETVVDPLIKNTVAVESSGDLEKRVKGDSGDIYLPSHATSLSNAAANGHVAASSETATPCVRPKLVSRTRQRGRRCHATYTICCRHKEGGGQPACNRGRCLVRGYYKSRTPSCCHAQNGVIELLLDAA